MPPRPQSPSPQSPPPVPLTSILLPNRAVENHLSQIRPRKTAIATSSAATASSTLAIATISAATASSIYAIGTTSATASSMYSSCTPFLLCIGWGGHHCR